MFTLLITFHGANGAQPQAGLVQGADGGLYGTALANGPVNLDEWESAPSSRPRLTASSARCTYLAITTLTVPQPAAGLAAGADGAFYGTTVFGGTNHGSFGTIFRLDTNGTHTTVARSAAPMAPILRPALVRRQRGNFYGTTAYGGTNNTTNGGDGTVFRITTNGLLTVLASLGTTNGANPLADWLWARMATSTARRKTAARTTRQRRQRHRLQDNHQRHPHSPGSFRGTNGANPAAGLTLGPDGNFYGTTVYGGTNDVANGGDGTVFRVTTNGTLTRLISFHGTNGANPQAALAFTNGTFYGTTASGGDAGDGTVFKITTNGTFASLYSFRGGNDGANPTAALTLGTDGNLYGTTSNGGTNYSGVAFRITPDGVFTPLYSLTGDGRRRQPGGWPGGGRPKPFLRRSRVRGNQWRRNPVPALR